MSLENPKIVIGVIGNDIHEMGNKIIDSLLRLEGYEVFNLGVSVSPIDFVNTAKEKEADAIIISSLNGRAKEDCKVFMKFLQESFSMQPPVYLGGYLATEGEVWEKSEKFYLGLGFHRVYAPGVPIEVTIHDLQKDLIG